MAEQLREAVILAVILRTPAIAVEFESELDHLNCLRADAGQIRDAILRASGDPSELFEHVADCVGRDTLETYLAQPHLSIVPCLRHEDDAEMARMTVAEELAKLDALRGLEAEIAEAQEDLMASDEEALTWRLRQAADAMEKAHKSGQEDTAEYDVGDNGAAINRQERKSLDALLETIRFSKPGR